MSLARSTNLERKAGDALVVTVMSVLVGLLVWWIQQISAPDFRQFSAGAERKQVFVEFLLPMIKAQNRQIRNVRTTLLGWRIESEELSRAELPAAAPRRHERGGRRERSREQPANLDS